MITKQCLDAAIKDSAPIYYIPNPVDISATNSEASSFKEQHRLDFRYALYLGWVIPTKGIEELILAWNTTHHSNMRLVVAGPFDPAYLARLSALVTDTSIDFIGEVDHDRAMFILSKAEFLILPSYSEGFPNVILEAMALRRAVLSTSVGAIPDILSGGCGLVVEPRSAEALGPPLQKLIDDPIYTTLLGLNGFERCKNTYDIDTVFDMYLDVWNSLASWKR
ncbi:MAG: glycosyltransferase family 4 protein [Candidatus Accumulibacter sp.]|nr:glycosyltransferase family 4 protein [Candidatus Accumulibacter necessarius]